MSVSVEKTPEPPSTAVAVPTSLPMRIFQFLLPLIIVAAGAFVLVQAARLRPPPPKEKPEGGPLRVETVEVAPYTEPLVVNVDGSVVPFREIALASEVSGRIIRKSDDCRAGHFVTAGALLFEIDPVDYELEVRRLAKQLRQAEISLGAIDVESGNTQRMIALAEEDLQLQRNEVRRLESLMRNGASSASELEGAKRAGVAARNTLTTYHNQAKTLENRRDAEQAALELAATSLERAEIDLKRTKVVAPIDGVVVQERVEKDAFVQRGSVLVDLEDTLVAEVRCSLRMEQLYWLWSETRSEKVIELAASISAERDYELPPLPARVIYQLGDTQFVWQGHLGRFDGSGIDPRTRTVPIRVVVPRPREGRCLDDSLRVTPPALVRGMFVSVEIEVRPERPLAKIPVAALQPGNVVWRVVDGTLQRSQVEVAKILDEVVLLNLNPDQIDLDDRLVITPLAAPEDGMPVLDLTSGDVAPPEIQRVSDEGPVTEPGTS